MRSWYMWVVLVCSVGVPGVDRARAAYPADCVDAGDVIPPSWPDGGQWAPVMKGSTYLADPNRSAEGDDFNSSDHRNIVGDAGYNPSAYIFRDANFFYFRLRVDKNPIQAPPRNFKSFGWAIELNVDGGVDCNGHLKEYHAYCMLDGTGGADNVAVRRNDVMGKIGDPSDSAETLIIKYPLATYPYARSVAASGHAEAHMNSAINGDTDHFIDIACRIRAMECATFSNSARMRFIFGTSNSTQGIRADILNPQGVTPCPAPSCGAQASCGTLSASASNPYDCPPPTYACVNVGCSNDSECSGTTPVCNITTNDCVACNGDYAAPGANRRCALASPYCTATGACGVCTSDADCAATNAGRSGAFCNTTNGRCVSSCAVDSDCGPGNLCVYGSCYKPVANGSIIPDGGTCTGDWPHVCDAGVCDSTDNRCGYLNGNGSCDAGVAEKVCRTGFCDPGDGRCGFANGSPCDAGIAATLCRSTTCADGVCCSGACTEQCAACNIAGSVGTCRAMSGAPDGGRAPCASDGTSCGGSCNGVLTTACTYPGAETACRAASCSAGTQTLAASCTADAGACPTLVMNTCTPYICGATACKTTCAGEGNCLSGYYCGSGSCAAKKANGVACGAAVECTSGRCADGVCCNAGCMGQCEACNVGGSVGTCTAVVGAPRGTRPACFSDGTSCAGTCNGVVTVECTYPGAGTSCRSASCAGGTETLAASCTGDAGTCPTLVTNACSPYICGAAACKTTCASESDCASDYTCAAGSCVAKKANGGTCGAGGACISGICVDGVCCNAACTDQCAACNIAGSVGTCTAVTGAPRGIRAACSSDGTSCAGSCNGVLATACTYPGAGTSCRSASCANATETVAAACTADAGHCPALTTNSCGAYACGASACKVSCAGDTDCAVGTHCASGTCVTKKANGTSCGAARECTSGICVDGFCCDRACNAQCEACDVDGGAGTCQPVSGAPHGTRTACAGGVAGCGGSCNGLVATECSYPGDSVTCRAASCASGVATLVAACNGAGACPAAQTETCPTASCAGTICAGDCKTIDDCPSGKYCAAGVCKAKKTNGVSCGAATECESGHCIDGTCCNSACTGQCQACDVAGAQGTCTTVSGAPHGARAACATDGTTCGGSCNGSLATACAYPTSATSCRSASCANEIATLAAGCDSTGHCPPEERQFCGAAGCGATLCAGDCPSGSDAECVGGKFCAGGICAPKKSNGGSCTRAAECTSGFCVDGACCNSACAGNCEACDKAGSVGTCTAVSGASRGTRPLCSAIATTCAAICDGVTTATCTRPGTSVSCRSASCTEGVATLAASCNGAGACPGVETQSCSPYRCGTSACAGNCGTDDDCNPGTYCAAGICALTKGTGETCGAANQCTSGHCVDGVCCTGACTAQCAACDVAGSAGTCVAVTGAPRGPRAACVGDGTACQGTCDGAQTTRCSFPGAATTCRAASCASGVATAEARCDGAGFCPAAAQVTCDPYRCADAGCGTTCSTNSDCLDPASCVQSSCGVVESLGQPSDPRAESFSQSNRQVSGSGLRGCAVASGVGVSFVLIAPALLLLAFRRRKRL